MRPNLCKPEIVNKCPEMEFTNKEMRRQEGDKEEREGGETDRGNEVTLVCS